MNTIKPDVKIDREKKKAYVKTAIFRVAFPQVFEAVAFDEDQQPKYSLTMMYPKKHDCKWLQNAIAEVKKMNFGDKVPKFYKHPLKDGDDMDHAANHGNWILRASTNAKRRPQVIDRNKELITDEQDFYGGCWARATITIAAYKTKTSAGVTAYLTNIQKVKDDQKLGGAPDADNQFEELELDEDDASNYPSRSRADIEDNGDDEFAEY